MAGTVPEKKRTVMRREHITGRDSVLETLRAAWRRGAQRGYLVVLRGPTGIGKTRLMEDLARPRRFDARPAVWVNGREATDAYGVDEVLDVLRKDFNRLGHLGLIDAVSVLARLRTQSTCPVSSVIAELSKVLTGIGESSSCAVLVDDALEIPDPIPMLLAARRSGCLAVAAVRDDLEPTPAAAELVAMADEVIDLGPLTDEQIMAAMGEEPHENVHQLLRDALGPLYGNPGTTLRTWQDLGKRGRLTPVGDQLRLADPEVPVALPAEHDLLRRTRTLGSLAPRLLAVAATLGGLDVDDLPQVAKALDENEAECGWLVDKLVELGVLVSDDCGLLDCLCPALAAAVVAEESGAVRRSRMASVVRPIDWGKAPRTRPATTDPARSVPSDWSAVDTRIAELIGRGCTNRRIASEFGVSEKTVEAHLTQLFAKTGCRSRVQLVTVNLHGRSRSTARGAGAGQQGVMALSRSA